MAFFRPLEVVTSKKLCALLFALLLEHNMLVTAVLNDAKKRNLSPLSMFGYENHAYYFLLQMVKNATAMMAAAAHLVTVLHIVYHTH